MYLPVPADHPLCDIAPHNLVRIAVVVLDLQHSCDCDQRDVCCRVKQARLLDRFGSGVRYLCSLSRARHSLQGREVRGRCRARCAYGWISRFRAGLSLDLCVLVSTRLSPLGEGCPRYFCTHKTIRGANGIRPLLLGSHGM